MGFFSWKTSDTNKSISNRYSLRGALPVYLVTPKNEYIYEDDYEGYGIFGGFDAYALVAQWNYPEFCNGDNEHDRHIGISIACYDEDNRKLKYPLKFSERPIPYNQLSPSDGCPEQGFFYDDTDDEDIETDCDENEG